MNPSSVLMLVFLFLFVGVPFLCFLLEPATRKVVVRRPVRLSLQDIERELRRHNIEIQRTLDDPNISVETAERRLRFCDKYADRMREHIRKHRYEVY